MSLEIIRKLMEKSFYKRLDKLQDDVFTVLQEIRSVSRTDSEVRNIIFLRDTEVERKSEHKHLG